ncbi:hypothetical protein HPB50_001358 [Hyalomma asiaticum]|uniref:Uncharacterized protein n=1 Tax=Hyalomma asiaticum TaxID=266040 RepID=A0ACB7RTK6_HYAAI|nr:hypothetical protein HPB50_001358 [Hyalomma asiaticum]
MAGMGTMAIAATARRADAAAGIVLNVVACLELLRKPQDLVMVAAPRELVDPNKLKCFVAKDLGYVHAYYYRDMLYKELTGLLNVADADRRLLREIFLNRHPINLHTVLASTAHKDLSHLIKHTDLRGESCFAELQAYDHSPLPQPTGGSANEL